MNRFLPTLAAACMAMSATAFAQQTPPPGGERKGPTPEQRQQMKERMKVAHEACKDKPDRHACMAENSCAKSEDPAKCQARARERHAKMAQRMDERQKAHEACTGKRGEELGKCLQEQRGKSGRGHHMQPKG